MKDEKTYYKDGILDLDYTRKTCSDLHINI